MDENEITQRLRDAGDQPVPGEVRASHLTRMHAATPVVEKQKRFGRLAVAAAAFVGFAVGSTGFAMAGALPAPAQQVAHDVLAVVQVDVPDRPDNRGKCISEAARMLDGDAEKQRKAECKATVTPGRPDHAGAGKGAGKGKPAHAGGPGGPNKSPHEGDPCKGPPPWAGKGAKDVSETDKRVFADARATCAPDAADDDQGDVEEREAPETEATETPAPQGEGTRPEQAPPADSGTPPAGAPEAQPELPAPLDPADGTPDDPAKG